MPRRKYTQPRVRWELQLDADLAGEIELFLLNPATGRPRYGARNQLVESLLREWLRARKRPRVGSHPEESE